MSLAKLIVLSGLDGSGKSTQIEFIKKYFKEHYIKYEYIHFPIYGNNEASNVIASYLRGEFGDINEVDPVFVANIYAMDRFLYLPTLQKQLEENDVVLLDRYVFCNMAYQGAKYSTDTQSKIMRDWIDEFEFGFLELPYPDLNIFFDVPIDAIKNRLLEKREGNDRKYLKGKADIHEANMEFQEKVRENYLAMKDYQSYKIINCYTEDSTANKDNKYTLLSPEEVFKTYQTQLERTLMIPKYYA